MSIEINLDNYEAFYLDYLENNLNKEEKNAFEFFLSLHPELKLETEDLLILDEAFSLDLVSIKLDESSKTNLKFITGQEKIDTTNIEQFLVASVEKELNTEKEQELKAFIQTNKNFQKDLDLYKKTILPLEHISYPEKQKLKQTKVYPLIFRAFAVAASLILVVLALKNLNSTTVFETTAPKAISKNQLKKTIEKEFKKEDQTEVTETIETPKLQYAKNNELNTSVVNSKTNNPTTKEEIATLNPLKYTTINTDSKETSIEKLNIKLSEEKSASKEIPITSSFVSVNEMNAPLKIVTDGIKEKFNQDLDFRTAKATNKKQGGFYVKVGNIEITRKKKPVSDELAVVY